MYDASPRLGQIEVPTLVVVGDYEWLTPPSATQALAADIRSGSVAW